jgi:hypothetical protein
MKKYLYFHLKTDSFIIRKRLLLCLLFSFFASSHFDRVNAEELSSPEYSIKAAFLLNFGKFIEWPPPPSGASPAFLDICILGKNPFGDALNSISEQAIQSRKVKVSSVNSVKDIHMIQNCDILFISRSEKEKVPEILRITDGYPILTVADQNGLAKLGVIINLITIDDKVRFEINLRSAKKAGFKLSSQLLKLATEISE